MTDAEIKAAVTKALEAYEALPFKELMDALGARRALAYRPALVTANQLLRFIADDLNGPIQKPE